MVKYIKSMFILLIILSTSLSCSDDDNGKNDKLIKYESDLLGTWSVIGINKGISLDDISTDCEREKSFFVFGHDDMQIKRGYDSNDACKQETYTYDYYNVTSVGDVTIGKDNLKYKYSASYKGDILYFSMYSSQLNNNDPEIVKKEDRKYYLLKRK